MEINDKMMVTRNWEAVLEGIKEHINNLKNPRVSFTIKPKMEMLSYLNKSLSTL